MSQFLFLSHCIFHRVYFTHLFFMLLIASRSSLYPEQTISLLDNVCKYCQSNTEYKSKAGLKTSSKSEDCMWRDYITLCVCVCVKGWEGYTCQESLCFLSAVAVTVTLSWAQGFGDDDVEVTRVLAYPLHAAVPLCACVWAELRAKHGRSAVSRDSIAAKLSGWGVCVMLDWCLIGVCCTNLLQLLPHTSLTHYAP